MSKTNGTGMTHDDHISTPVPTELVSGGASIINEATRIAISFTGKEAPLPILVQAGNAQIKDLGASVTARKAAEQREIQARLHKLKELAALSLTGVKV